ncbi:MAG: STAS domain-containing protein [Ignavibacteria bacterium]|jgi:anti-sigma B factor antagonist/stage II sporulation protein AA (anti-sigma F factor antagonist)|nr:STAS domain-containing protein [Ignavibacteria bacterium]MDH7526605.1 STAS domain-containing protein [Ignavibacteria bacterium]NPV11441.1 STAS domain-containing protein [Ignavibacteria bacterium]
MTLRTNRLNDIFVVDVNIPRTSIYLANDFKELIFNAIENGEKYIIVDFSKCEFVDSTFLGVLVISYKRLIPIGGNIHLVVNNQNIIASLDMTRMSKIFKIFSTVDEAVNNFTQVKN